MNRSEDFQSSFVPLQWQVKPFFDTSPVLLLTGSAGGGKSRVAAEKVHRFCLDYPGACWLIMRKAREWCSRSIIPFYDKTVVAGDPRVTISKSQGIFRYSNGSIVYSGGMMDEKQRESIRSIGGAGGLDGCWMEEGNAFTRQDFDEISARLRHDAADYRQIIITTNPGGPRHWINTDLIKGGQATVYYSGAKDNRYNPSDYINTLHRLTGMLYQRLVLGHWVQAEGVIFDNFDTAVHVMKRLDQEFRLWYMAIDEGYTNPAVILLIGVDHDNHWHVAREFYQTGVLQADFVNYALNWTHEKGVSLCAVDAAAAGLIAELRNNGIPAEPAKGRVIDGIRAVQDRLAIQGNGKPILTIDPRCTNLISEFETYSWQEGKDAPKKENDHACDALRYCINLCDSERTNYEVMT